MEQHVTAKSLNEACQYALLEELVAIRKLSDNVGPDGTIVMIGAGPAVFALAMLEKRENPPTLFIIDIDTVQWAQAHLTAGGCDLSKVHYLLGDSFEIGTQRWEFREIDLLLVDGDHSYPGVSRDIAAWLPHVKPGGIFWFHDYLARSEGFNGSGMWEKSDGARAIDWCAELNKLAQVGISIICEKVT
jgi:hypothetical protein